MDTVDIYKREHLMCSSILLMCTFLIYRPESYWYIIDNLKVDWYAWHTTGILLICFRYLLMYCQIYYWYKHVLIQACIDWFICYNIFMFYILLLSIYLEYDAYKTKCPCFLDIFPFKYIKFVIDKLSLWCWIYILT